MAYRDKVQKICAWIGSTRVRIATCDDDPSETDLDKDRHVKAVGIVRVCIGPVRRSEAPLSTATISTGERGRLGRGQIKGADEHVTS